MLPYPLLHRIQLRQPPLRLRHQFLPPRPQPRISLRYNPVQLQYHLRQYPLAQLLVLEILRFGVVGGVRHEVLEVGNPVVVEVAGYLVEGFGGGGRFFGGGRGRGGDSAGWGGLAGGGGGAVCGAWGGEEAGGAGGSLCAVAASFSAFLAAAVAFAFAGLAVADDGAVDVDSRAAGVEAVCREARGRAGGAVVAVVAVGFGGYDEQDVAVLLQVFVSAGDVVFAEFAAFVQELDAAVVVGFGFAGGAAADFADFEAAFGDVEGVEVEGIGGAFVLQDEDVGGQGGLGSAGAVGLGGGEAVAVVAVATWGIGFVVYDVVVVIFGDSRRRTTCVGEGGIAPSTVRPVAAHKEEECDQRE